MSMYRHVPDGIGRPHTSGESIQCALDEIEGIVREKNRSAVPYLFEDVDRPSTFPGKSRNSQKYAETSMSSHSHKKRYYHAVDLVSMPLSQLPMAMGAVRGKKLASYRKDWHPVMMSPEDRDRKRRNIFLAKRVQSPPTNHHSTRDRIGKRKSDTERFLDRLESRSTSSPKMSKRKSMYQNQKLVKVNSKLLPGPSKSFVVGKEWRSTRRPWTTANAAHNRPVPGVKRVALVEDEIPIDSPIVDAKSAQATLRRWSQFCYMFQNELHESNPVNKVKQKLKTLKHFMADPAQERPYDSRARLRLAVTLESLDLLFDHFADKEDDIQFRKALHKIRDEILSALYAIQDFVPKPGHEARFSTPGLEESFYYKIPTFSESCRVLQGQRDGFQEENKKLRYTLLKAKARVYQLERELGTSHTEINNQIKDEMNAVRVLGGLEEVSQYRAIHLSMNRVRKKSEDSKKSLEMQQKYEAEAHAGVMDILRSCASIIPKEQVLSTLDSFWKNREEEKQEDLRNSTSGSISGVVWRRHS